MAVPNGQNASGVRGSALMHSGDEGTIKGEGIAAGLYTSSCYYCHCVQVYADAGGEVFQSEIVEVKFSKLLSEFAKTLISHPPFLISPFCPQCPNYNIIKIRRRHTAILQNASKSDPSAFQGMMV
jgi:hypothetical protein